MWTLFVIATVILGVDAKGIKLHLSDEMKSMLEKSNWDHQDTALSYIKPTSNVIQRRIDGETDFLRNWKDYKNGFGHSDHEYWLGNDAIHALTEDKNQVLRIDLMKFSREKAHAIYSSFFVDNEANKYKLTLGSFNGTKGLGDSFGYSNNSKFSTTDRDNDNDGSRNCVQKYKAPGWMKHCFEANLNGVYRKTSLNDYTELHWQKWGKTVPLKSAKMMIRPKQK